MKEYGPIPPTGVAVAVPSVAQLMETLCTAIVGTGRAVTVTVAKELQPVG